MCHITQLDSSSKSSIYGNVYVVNAVYTTLILYLKREGSGIVMLLNNTLRKAKSQVSWEILIYEILNKKNLSIYKEHWRNSL